MATLDDIVSAAAKVFRTKGYHAATVRDIADEVGILKGSLYHHFDSKEELLYLVVKEPIAQMFRTIAEIAAAEGGAAEKLTRAISAHLEAFDRHYPHLFVYLRERESRSEEHTSELQSQSNLVCRLLLEKKKNN